MATAAAPETEDPQRPTDTAAGALLACLSDACASPAAAYRPAPPDAVAAAVALLARPAAQISSDDDDSSKTSSLHGSESSKSLSSSPPPSQREATEQSRKDIRREPNRQHARVSRERKRKKMQSLEEENVALKARVAELEAALAAR